VHFVYATLYFCDVDAGGAQSCRMLYCGRGWQAKSSTKWDVYTEVWVAQLHKIRPFVKFHVPDSRTRGVDR
jgi:hypothetical protein